MNRFVAVVALAATLAIAPGLAIAPSAASPSSELATSPSDTRSQWSVAVSQSALRLGVEHSARIDVRGPDVLVSELELRASVGSVHDVTRVGPGAFTARYDAPVSRAPDVALIMARSDSAPIPGVAAIALAGRYRLTVDVEPNARVTVQLADGTTHRAVAPRSGVLDVVMHVAPGIDRARLQATDAGGNETERMEPIQGIALHRMLLLRAPSSITDRAIRWFVISALPSGALADAIPDTIEVTGGLGAIERRASGVFEVRVNPARRADAAVVAIALHEANVDVTPSRDEIVVPANRPSSLQLSGPERLRAGEVAVFQLIVDDEGGEAVTGLATRIGGTFAGASARVEDAGLAYRVVVTSPERVGRGELVVRLPMEGGPLEVRRALVVDAGPPARIDAAVAQPLRVGTSREITLTAHDRFGNPASVGNPSLSASNAVLRNVRVRGGVIDATIEPTAVNPGITVVVDYSVRQTIALRAQPIPERSVVLSGGAFVRTNFGATVFAGGRLSLIAQFPIVQAWDVLAAFDAGVEGAIVSDMQGNRVMLLAVPTTARVGIQRRLDHWRFGLVAGAVLRAARANTTYASGTMASEWSVAPGAAATAVIRYATAFGTFGVELGVESGSLDTPHARGTLGGLQAMLGWGIAL